jgi:hypothetical protein
VLFAEKTVIVGVMVGPGFSAATVVEEWHKKLQEY